MNLPFREPLVPTGAAVDLGSDMQGRPDGVAWEKVSTAVQVPQPEAVSALAGLLTTVERGVIVAGAMG